MPIIAPYRVANHGGRGLASFGGWNAAVAYTGYGVSGLHNSVLTDTSGHAGYEGSIRGETAKTGGKRVFAVTLTKATTDIGFGICDGGVLMATWVGQVATSWGLWLSGNGYNTGSGGGTGTGAFVTGDTMMFACDLDNGKMWFGKNGTWQGDPAAGTGNFYTGMSGGTFYVMGSTVTLNDNVVYKGHSTNYPYSIPSGFTGWENA